MTITEKSTYTDYRYGHAEQKTFIPWTLRPDDFLIPSAKISPDLDAMKERFAAQATLLDELIQPCPARLSPMDGARILRGDPELPISEYLGAAAAAERAIAEAAHFEQVCPAAAKVLAQGQVGYDHEVYREIQEARSAFRKDYSQRDACVFQMSADSAPCRIRIESLQDVPFQGTGGWGLAVLPSKTNKETAGQMLSKLSLSVWLGHAVGVEAVAVVRASKLALKRIGELEAAGIPVLFDFSKRLSGEVVDPLANKLVANKRGRRGIFKFAGTLTQEQAASFGEELDAKSLIEVLNAMSREFTQGRSSFGGTTMPVEAIEALTLGREKWPGPIPDQAGARGRPSRHRMTHWVETYIDISSDNLPSRDISQLKVRLVDISRIWVSKLDEYSLFLAPFTWAKGDGNGGSIVKEPAFEKFPELAAMFGIDETIEAYYENVPIEDLLA